MDDVQVIKDFYGRIIGKIYTRPNGDKVAKDFYGRIVGTYYKSRNVTVDFYGRIVVKGDGLNMLLSHNPQPK